MHKKNRKLTMNIKNKLEYLRGRIQAERIGTGKIMELQSLADHIEPDDVLLAEWAGIPEEVFAQKR